MLSLCFAVPNEDTNLTAVDLSSSIYAPLAGCDDGTFTDKVFSGNISIHAPLAGCDGKSRGLTPDTRRFQSTHPLRGATSRAPTRTMMPCHFNPRTPCGVRPGFAAAAVLWHKNFNPRTPCGVRPPSPPQSSKLRSFQSTHPLRGATEQILLKAINDGHISIHAPLAGCDCLASARNRHRLSISIHAPLAGCDVGWVSFDLAYIVFQSTHPLRGATIYLSVLEHKVDISIHAPLAGCDERVRCVERVGRGISIHAPLAGCDSTPRT